MSKAQVLVSLVGRSPIPILIGCRDLAPDGCSHLLVCTDQTKVHADRIRKVIADQESEILVLEDGKNPQLILSQLEGWLVSRGKAEIILNYTGGTKAMAAASVACLAAAADGELWYLDESSNTYRSFQGENFPAGSVVSVDEVLSLHGWNGKPNYSVIYPSWKELCDFYDSGLKVNEKGYRSIKKESERFDYLEAFVIDLLPDNQRMSRIVSSWKEWHQDGRTASLPYQEEWEKICEFHDLMPSLVEKHFPSCSGVFQSKKAVKFDRENPWTRKNDWAGEFLKSMAVFFQGIWLEEFVRQGIKRAFIGRAEEITDAYEIWPEEEDLSAQKILVTRREVDSLILRENGITLVSVTRSGHSSSLREKLYEGITIAQSIGGDMAVAFVVAPASEDQIISASLDSDASQKGRIMGWELLDAMRAGDDEAVRRSFVR